MTRKSKHSPSAKKAGELTAAFLLTIALIVITAGAVRLIAWIFGY